MASHSRSAEEAKERGNKFVKATPPDYEKALVSYTEAIALDATSHTALSNRSLVFYKLGRFEEALADASKSIEISPKWAKGYLRKCSALIAINRNKEALAVAQEGFKLMHSSVLCRELVSHWLKACKALFVKYENVIRIPTGILILSEVYFNILVSSISTMTSSSAGMTEKLLEENLMKSVEEFERLLGGFGEPHHSYIRKWAGAVTSQLDQTISTIPPQGLTSALQDFIKYLNSSLHVALHPIARPLLALALVVIQARAFALNCSNTGHRSMEYLSGLCLPFFDRSILNTSEYVGFHLGIVTGLVESYVKGGRDTEEDISAIDKHCDRIEALLQIYPTSEWEYVSRKDIAESDLIYARNYVKTKQSQRYMLGTTSAVNIQKQETSKRESPLMLLQIAKRKQMHELFIQDADNLIMAAVDLFKTSDVVHGKLALTAAESIYLNIFGLQLSRGVWALDELQPAIASARWLLLLNVVQLLKDIDIKVTVNTIFRWKGLFSRFRSLLIQKGLGNTYLSTFLALQHVKASGIHSDVVKATTTRHKQQELDFVKDHSFQCLTVATSVPLDVECILEPDEMIIDFLEFSDIYSKGITAMYATVVLPDGDLLIVPIDTENLSDLMHHWDRSLAENATNAILKGKQISETASHEVGIQLCSVLFPPSVQQRIHRPEVRHIYVCSSITCTLPLELLPSPDGSPLFKGRSICYTNSYQELTKYVQFVKREMDENDSKDAAVSAPSDTTSAQQQQTMSKRECYIIADPNYDLQSSQHQISIWEQFADMWKPPVSVIGRLPSSHAEAQSVAEILSADSRLSVHVVTGDHATLGALIDLDSPFLLHISTHGFSQPHIGLYRGQFWDDTKSGLILAGYNTYLRQKYSMMVSEAGIGMLNSLGACGLKLSNTCIVFISTCVSGIGITAFQESSTSLADALQAAGAQTVIASRWNVADEPTYMFVKYFYKHLLIPGIRPSEALLRAREEMCHNHEQFRHWYNWAGFVCYGLDWPVFSS